MFTGIVKEIGIVRDLQVNAEGKRLKIAAKDLLPLMQIDDSVSVNGACQTVIEKDNETFTVQAVHVTLEKTTLGSLKAQSRVNLELALRPLDFMGGHMVTGHVNCLGKLVSVQNYGKNYEVAVEVPKEQMKYIVKEGSITLNGTSLTVADVNHELGQLKVSLIPHTWQNTTLSDTKIGEHYNVEVDILAKYLENLIFHREGHIKGHSLTEDWLRRQGY
jgi:riboflavin synthase